MKVLLVVRGWRNIGLVVGLFVLGVFSVGFGVGWVVHQPASVDQLAPISFHSTRAEVQKHFDLGTNSVGLPQYTDTTCISKTPFPVCAFDYSPDSHTWAVTLYVRQPQASIAVGPPVREDG